jgi:hypothetical protein
VRCSVDPSGITAGGISAEEKLLQAGPFCVQPGSAFPIASQRQMPKGVEEWN